MTDPGLDELVEEILSEFADRPGGEYVRSMVTSAIGLGRDSTGTLNLKLAASALREMREAFLMFAPYANRRKVTIFGSARVARGDPLFDQTALLASALADEGWMCVTGAGPGIMEAGMVGAGRAQSIGVSIRLPFESSANTVIAGDTKFVSMRYFFTRKLMLVKESHAFVCMPGGFGTLDEMFELLTLTQTGKGLPVPIVLMDRPEDPFWRSVEALIEQQLLPRRLISAEDVGLFRVCDHVQEAVGEITGFYRNFDSIRYIGNRLVVRVRLPVDAELIDSLDDGFAHLCVSGGFESVGPHPREVADGDAVHMHRISFRFNRADFGGLRRLIDHLNRWIPRSVAATPPPSPPIDAPG
jgi:uncharacterized protein (TIGR00730 family)